MANKASIYGHNTHAPARRQAIDLALAVMCVLATPGRCYRTREIAEVTGMSHGGAWAIEKAALHKLRKRLVARQLKDAL